jgi:hypothetical protein
VNSVAYLGMFRGSCNKSSSVPYILFLWRHIIINSCAIAMMCMFGKGGK